MRSGAPLTLRSALRGPTAGCVLYGGSCLVVAAALLPRRHGLPRHPLCLAIALIERGRRHAGRAARRSQSCRNFGRFDIVLAFVFGLFGLFHAGPGSLQDSLLLTAAALALAVVVAERGANIVPDSLGAHTHSSIEDPSQTSRPAADHTIPCRPSPNCRWDEHRTRRPQENNVMREGAGTRASTQHTGPGRHTGPGAEGAGPLGSTQHNTVERGPGRARGGRPTGASRSAAHLEGPGRAR